MITRKVKLKACSPSELAVKPKPNKIYTEKRIYPVPKQKKKKKAFCSKLTKTDKFPCSYPILIL